MNRSKLSLNKWNLKINKKRLKACLCVDKRENKLLSVVL